jgi:hypothetical protein
VVILDVEVVVDGVVAEEEEVVVVVGLVKVVEEALATGKLSVDAEEPLLLAWYCAA